MVITWTYRILISCPGDVHEYFMQTIEAAVAEFNEQMGNKLVQKHFELMYGHRVSVEILFWRENSHPVFLSGASGQDVINEQLVNVSDATIGLFYTRLGTPTEKYESGTVEEIEKTLGRGKHVAIIPIVDSVVPTELLGDGSEYAKMKQYLKKIRSEKRGLINDCAPKDLKRIIMDQFNEIIGQNENIGQNETGEKYKAISLVE